MQCRLGKCIIRTAVGDGEKGGIQATPWVGFGSVELFINWYTYHAYVLFGDHACLTNSMLTTPLPILYVAIAPPVSSLSGLAIIPPASVLTSVARISEPMFIRENGTPLTRVYLVAAVRSALSQAGINVQGYSGHSFRIGAAAAAAGLSDSLIQSLGRWKSSAFMTYIQTPPEQLIAVSSQLLNY